MPLAAKIGLISIVAVATFWAVASAVVPRINDPAQSLSRSAKRVAQGPKSGEDAKRAIAEFDKAVKAFLTKNGTLPPSELAHKLQDLLNSPAFEVHAFGLPRGLKIIEVDTVLQAADYLVMTGSTGTKVITLPDLEVFDGAQIIVDKGAPNLVLIGHTGGQGSHKPRIKVLSLLPDDAADRTGTAAPEIKGEGTAAFATNQRDITVDQSLYSLGASAGLFKFVSEPAGKVDDETVRAVMSWKDGHYTLNQEPGKGPLAALYAVSLLFQQQPLPDGYKRYVDGSVDKFVASNSDLQSQHPEFSISRAGVAAGKSRRRRRLQKSDYVMTGTKGSIVVALEPKGSGSDAYWAATAVQNIDKAKASLVADKAAVEQSKDKKEAQTDLAQTQAKELAQKNQQQKQQQQIAASQVGQQQVLTSTSVPMTDVNPPRKVPATIVEKRITQHVEPGTRQTVKVATVVQERPKQEVEAPGETMKAEPEKQPKKPEEEKRPHAAVQPQVKEPETISETKSSPTSAHTTSPVNLRTGPGHGYKPFSTLVRGAPLEVLSNEHGWCKVRSNGQEGYIYSAMVDFGRHGAPASTKPPESEHQAKSPAEKHPEKPSESKHNKTVTSEESTPPASSTHRRHGSSSKEAKSHKSSSSQKSKPAPPEPSSPPQFVP